MQREDSKVPAATLGPPTAVTFPPNTEYSGGQHRPCLVKGKESVETANTHLDPKLVTKEDDRAGSFWRQKRNALRGETEPEILL